MRTPPTPVQTPSTPSPIFIGGCPRSGTTMLGGMLGTAPDALTVPEATFKWSLFARLGEDGTISRAALREVLGAHWQFPAWHADTVLSGHGGRSGSEDPVALTDALTDMAAAYGTSVGRPGTRWVDHTPGNIRWATTLFSLFPDARLVNIVRDGRAAAASVIPLEWGPSTITEAAAWWSTAIAQGLAAHHRFPDRVLTVRYEDLVAEPEVTLRALCRELGLAYTPEMLSGGDYRPPGWTHSMHRMVGREPDATRAHRWRDRLSAREVEVFESQTQELLDYLGYDLDYGAAAMPPTRGERLLGTVTGLIRLASDKVRRVRLERRGFTQAQAGRPQ